jgi:hypothetical protein
MMGKLFVGTKIEMAIKNAREERVVREGLLQEEAISFACCPVQESSSS